MLIIGIAGGIASGKSYVASQFQALGAKLLDADKMGHAVLEQPAVIQQIKEQWGCEVLDAKGQVNRTALASIVFADTELGQSALGRLEEIVHPRIKEMIQGQISEHKLAGDRVVVLDAAVMFKTGLQTLCDAVVFVDASDEQRFQRALQRGWTRADLKLRERAQTPLSVKRVAADFVIDNSGTKEHAKQQVQQFWDSIVNQ